MLHLEWALGECENLSKAGFAPSYSNENFNLFSKRAESKYIP